MNAAVVGAFLSMSVRKVGNSDLFSLQIQPRCSLGGLELPFRLISPSQSSRPLFSKTLVGPRVVLLTVSWSPQQHSRPTISTPDECCRGQPASIPALARTASFRISPQWQHPQGERRCWTCQWTRGTSILSAQRPFVLVVLIGCWRAGRRWGL